MRMHIVIHESFESPAAMPYIQEVERIKEYDFSQMNKLLFTFLDHMQEIHELKNKELLTENISY